MVTQQGLVRDYLQTYGKITASEALINLSVQRLAAVIHALRKDGCDITSIRERGVGWSGKTTSHIRYEMDIR